MIDTDRKHAVDKMTSSSGIFDHLHPQANAFFQLFPQPDGSISLATIFAKQFQQLWNEKFKDQPWTLIGFSATKPSFDDQSAENGGNDYLCRIKVHIKDGSEEK